MSQAITRNTFRTAAGWSKLRTITVPPQQTHPPPTRLTEQPATASPAGLRDIFRTLRLGREKLAVTFCWKPLVITGIPTATALLSIDALQIRSTLQRTAPS